MGTTSIGMTYPASTGAGVTWASGYEANLTLLDNYLRGYLKRVDTGAWEAAQIGIEYYAPLPFCTFTTGVVCQKFSGTGGVAVTTLIASGISRVYGAIGYAINASGPTVHAILGQYDSTTGTQVYVTNGALIYLRDGNLDDTDDTYEIMVFYKRS
jgi:hypothetical protein